MLLVVPVHHVNQSREVLDAQVNVVPVASPASRAEEQGGVGVAVQQRLVGCCWDEVSGQLDEVDVEEPISVLEEPLSHEEGGLGREGDLEGVEHAGDGLDHLLVLADVGLGRDGDGEGALVEGSRVPLAARAAVEHCLGVRVDRQADEQRASDDEAVLFPVCSSRVWSFSCCIRSTDITTSLKWMKDSSLSYWTSVVVVGKGGRKKELV